MKKVMVVFETRRWAIAERFSLPTHGGNVLLKFARALILLLICGLPFCTRGVVLQASGCLEKGKDIVFTNVVDGCKNVCFSGTLSCEGLSNAIPGAAVLSCWFYNAKGKERVVAGWPHGDTLGSWKFLPATPDGNGFREEIAVPLGAVKVVLRLRCHAAKRLQLKGVELSHEPYFMVSVLRFWPFLIALSVLGVVGLAYWFSRRGIGFLRSLSLVFWGCLGMASLVVLAMLIVCSPVRFWLSPFTSVWVASLLIFTLMSRSLVFSRYPVAFIAVLVLVAHLVVIQVSDSVLSQRMCSDFLNVQRCLESGRPQTGHAPEFAYWCNYELLVSFLGSVLTPHLKVGQLLNVLACISVLPAFYRLSVRLSTGRMAAFATLFLGLYPASLINATLLSGELIGMALYFWAFFVFVETSVPLVPGGGTKMRLLGILLVGILVGMAQTMRPFAPLFLLAFVWGLFQVTLMCWNKKNVLGCVCTVFLMLGTYLIANKVLQSVFIEIAKPQKIVVDGGNLQRTLVKGLDVSGRGRWSLETSSLLQKMNNDEVSAYLKKRVQCDRKQYWPLFVDKFVYMNDFRSAGSVIGWYQKTIKSKLPEWAVGWGEDLCALSRWLFVLGTLGFLFSGWGTCQLKFLICNCVWGVVVGFTVLMSLVEVQGRYWTIVMPFYFLMIPYMGEWFSPGHSCYVGILRFWESRRRKGGCDDDKNLVSLLLRRIYNKILKRS